MQGLTWAFASEKGGIQGISNDYRQKYDKKGSY